MREVNKRALSVDASAEGHVAEADDLTPGPAPRRPPPSRDLPPEPSRSQPFLPSTTTPDHRSTNKPRPRHSSTASVPTTPPAESYSRGQLVASPTDDAQNAGASSPPTKKSWRRRDSQSSQKSVKSKQQTRGVHPSGGLASAIAGSGLALANPVMQRTIIPPVPPLPDAATRPRHNSSTSEIPLTLNPGIDRHAASRKTSMTYSNGGHETFEPRPADSSGSGSSEEEDDSSPDELDPLTEYAAPITGFAVASSRRTADFHALFPTVPEGDYLIEDYGCALQREILIQGRLYISENHVCFHANIFGWTTDLVIPIENITSLEKRMTAFVIPNALQISSSSGKYVFASLLSRDTTYDVIYNIWRSVRPDAPSPRGSLEGLGPSTSFNSIADGVEGPPQSVQKPLAGEHKLTMCACAREGKHFSEVAMETIIPGDPEKIYNLMFASGFIKDFMRNDEKLIDIQISDWAPIKAGSSLLQRNMSYIKPLSGSIGPKQTKCELTDEMVHLDYNEYITMLTTTRTPDVPSGGVFSVRTRTCLTWAGAAATKIQVTTQVEWTGRSFIRSIIERSCIDGQKTYHSNLERAMRAYIAAHKSEFIPQGTEVEIALVSPTTTGPPPTNDPISSEELRKAKEKERSQRGLQWALDTVEGTAKVAQQSFWGAIELIKDTWESSSTTAVLWFVVVGLVLSNIWTYARSGRKEDLEFTRRKVGKKVEEDVQRVVGESVRDAFRSFEEVVRGDRRGVADDVVEMRRRLEAVESKLSLIEGRLDALD
ncbi:hypothetical protein BU17DRAFT_58201 [Hysterangium stoloniferum]|nr:hypothetical protein BU17DRAFT_58201 [Hysterangium stoloniferum]